MVAGYSVGQLTAMYAAGMLGLDQTLELVAKRGAIMERSRAAADGAMLAVIGLATEVVEDVCRQVRDEGGYVVVANYNCLGQLTLSGTAVGVARAEAALTKLEPRKLARVPVQGAWHCALLDDVAAEYRATVLDQLTLAPRSCPVMDNVSGGPLPEEPDQVRAALASHLVSPVRWEQCVTTMVAAGVETFVEVGYGDMLTKFGFFIDRKKRHLPSAKVV
jgi:[acyl-carrier-protein] S-malonyltransferase